MSPFSGLRSLVAKLRDGVSSSADAETCDERGPPMLTDADEAQIYAILCEQGGRVRQQTIIKATGWSPAKVSRHLQRMEAEGHVGRVMTGREKTVALPEYLPAEATVE